MRELGRVVQQVQQRAAQRGRRLVAEDHGPGGRRARRHCHRHVLAKLHHVAGEEVQGQLLDARGQRAHVPRRRELAADGAEA
ncbi:MAG: hypothetical protein Q8O81_04025, partial [Giesbergeria sp.]|nr:hypothetical protein [Giesbergeria sp.]